MIQPVEMKRSLPMELSNGEVATTTDVWNVLVASRDGNLEKVKALVDGCPGLIYAQYNYTPPIHFAVREGHTELVKFLLHHGAHDPAYRIYPFQESLITIAEDREYNEIAALLQEYTTNPSACKFTGDNGKIEYDRTELEEAFQSSVDKDDLEATEKMLKDHPEFVHDETFFWGEGIMMMPAKGGNREMVELLLRHGAKVPAVLKWAQQYYFKHYEMAAFLMEKGMNPDVMSWHHVTLLHDMAQKGNIQKAELLIRHGAAIDSLDEEYLSTPLGMAARWGHVDMVDYLLKHGADPNKSAAKWSTPVAWARKKGFEEIERMVERAGGGKQ